MAPKPHQKIIGQVAREILRPAGFNQKGASRLWYLDCNWFACLAEFQPHNYDPGTFLNVGIRWLWHPDDSWSFSEFKRVGDFVKYSDDDSFRNEMVNLSKAAATYGVERQTSLKSPLDAYTQAKPWQKTKAGIGNILKHAILKSPTEAYTQFKNRGQPVDPWHEFDLGVLAGLSGNAERAKSHFETVVASDAQLDWELERWNVTEQLMAKLADEKRFSLAIEARIKDARALLKLPGDQQSYLP